MLIAFTESNSYFGTEGKRWQEYLFKLSNVVHVKSVLQYEIYPLTWETLNAFSRPPCRHGPSCLCFTISRLALLHFGKYTGIWADVSVYNFAHLHTTLSTEGNMLDMNWLQVTEKKRRQGEQRRRTRREDALREAEGDTYEPGASEWLKLTFAMMLDCS